MSDRRVLIPGLSLEKKQPGMLISVHKEFSHYIQNVLRMKKGDTIELCDGRSLSWKAKIKDCLFNEVVCELIASLSSHSSNFSFILAQGLPKSDKLDHILRQGTELGVHQFFPFLSERSVSRPDPKRSLRKHERWKKIVQEASRQCGRTSIPMVETLCSFQELLTLLPKEFPWLLCWENAQQYSLKQWLSACEPSLKGVVVFVGPEGGFSRKEILWAKERSHIQDIGLGPLILRTETAGPAVVSILQFTLGSLGGA